MTASILARCNGFCGTVLVAAFMMSSPAIAQDKASMATFVEAKEMATDFAQRYGVYAICHDLSTSLKAAGNPSDAAAVIKTIYQGSTPPAKVRASFLGKIEKTGLSFDQMMIVDDLLTREADRVDAKTRIFMATASDDQIVHVCSEARGKVMRAGNQP